jgi:LysM repeat protein
MRKLLVALLILPFAVFAQKNYKTHTVAAKENLSSIGRMYNINGRELANFNNIDYEKGLSLGQVLKIPIRDGEITAPQPVTPKTEAKAVPTNNNNPVYHTVEKKQTLYALSKQYNTTVDNIKKWNNLTDNALSEGTRLVVGYGTNELVKDVVITTKPDEAPKPTPAAVKKEEPVVAKPTPPEVKPVVKKETIAVVAPTDVKQEASRATNTTSIQNGAGNFGGGVFKNDFAEQAKSNHNITENGNGGVFKSTSGWQDGKYYCLHNQASPGTIIKITNNANGKSVYAKVLDFMPDIKQNAGLVICVSNAAADALSANESKLDCTLNYSK